MFGYTSVQKMQVFALYEAQNTDCIPTGLDRVDQLPSGPGGRCELIRKSKGCIGSCQALGIPVWYPGKQS